MTTTQQFDVPHSSQLSSLLQRRFLSAHFGNGRLGLTLRLLQTHTMNDKCVAQQSARAPRDVHVPQQLVGAQLRL